MNSKNSNLIGVVGDMHLGVRNNNKAFAVFQRKYILAMLDYYHSINVRSIIQLGDYVENRKSISGELIHWLSRVFIPKLAEYDMTYYQLQGNHSQCLLNSNEITFDQLLEDLSEVYGNSCVKAITSPTDRNIGGLDVCCIPWINKSTHDLTVDHLEKSEANICIGHLEIESMYLLKGGLSKTGHISRSHFNKFDQVVSGHLHISSKSGNLFFAGSPYALNWGEWEEPAEKGFYTLNTLSEKLTFIPNKPDQEMFAVIEYSYSNLASTKLGKKWLTKEYLEDVLHLKNKVIRINVTDRSNSAHYKAFLNTLRLINCVNFNVVDLTKEVETFEQDVTAEEFKTSTLDVLLEKVDETEGINNESVAEKLKHVYSVCLDKSNLI